VGASGELNFLPQPIIAPSIDPAPRSLLEPDFQRMAKGGGILRKSWSLGYLGSLAVAIFLFVQGLGIPFAYRVRGDAYQYLDAARKFDSFWSALTHVGDRANGLPLFEYLLKQQDSVLWTNGICIFIFGLHLLASAYLTRTVIQKRWLASNPFWEWILFSLLAVYPPMVMHASTPLTDTFGASLLIFAVCLLARVRGVLSAKDLTLATISGALFGYAITVRPAYEAGAIAFLMGLSALSLRKGEKQKACAVAIAILGCALYLTPTWIQCYEHYHFIGVQSPETFDPTYHAQVGLRGARLLWFRPELADGREFPILPDSFMRSNFYDRCTLKSIVGLNTSSLTGCLARKAILTPLLFAKKWIGLHDPFRLQPYTELMTPAWYPSLARTFAGLALCGTLLLWVSVSLVFRKARRFILPHDPWTGAVLLFVTALALQHLLLHVEERFSLAWSPYAFGALIAFVSRFPRFSMRMRWIACGTGTLVILIYWAQVLAWDQKVSATFW
jgi:hypothetical protein